MHIKTITILIAGAVFTAGLMMGFGGYVFAGDPVEGMDITIKQNPSGRVSDIIYASSFSKTKSIGQVRMEVGNVLLGYGFGGEYINQVTEALEGGGVYEAELRSFLIAVGMNEQDAQNILLEFDKIGIGDEGMQTVSPNANAGGPYEVSTPDAGDVSPSASEGTVKTLLPSGPGKEISTPGTGDVPQPAIVNQELHRSPTAGMGEQRFKSVDGLESETRSGGFIKLGDLPGKRAAFGDSSIKSIQSLKAAESDGEREEIRKELKASRQTLQESVQTLRQDMRENSKELRDNFREKIKTTIGHVDHGKTARVAVAHGRGLRMLNRFRSAMARFDHILGRMESRVEKIENEAQARSEGVVKDILPSEVALYELVEVIEEAKNTQVLNKAKLAELEAKYESLLLGEKVMGYLKIDGVEGDRAFIKIDGVEGEKANGYLKIDGVDGKRTYIESGDIKDERAIGYLKIDGVDGKRVMGYLKIGDIKGAMYIKIDGVKGNRAFMKLGDIKGEEISQGIGEEAREIAKELKSEIENLHAKLQGIATARFEINLR